VFTGKARSFRQTIVQSSTHCHYSELEGSRFCETVITTYKTTRRHNPLFWWCRQEVPPKRAGDHLQDYTVSQPAVRIMRAPDVLLKRT